VLRHTRLVSVAALSAATAAALVTPAAAAVPTDTTAFRDAVNVAGMVEHLEALQAAADANDGNRASGTSGYEASAQYVESQLRAAGYEPERQYFDFFRFEENQPGTLSRTSPTAEAYVNETDFDVMDYSGSTGGTPITAPLVAVADNVIPPGAPGSSSAGCEEGDFVDDFTGAIALIQRGTCDFAVKAANAAAAGAIGVLIFNEGQAPDRQEVLLGTLGGPMDIPVLGTSFAVGEELAGLLASGPVEVSLSTDTTTTKETTFNVLAQTDTGRTDRVVVVGAHLDSVAEGAGINDNGTGTAAILEIAEQLAEVQTTNAVRFAFFGAEEAGLLGAEHYVANLTARERKNIALNLNFDMLGSPNFARFIYDGDGSATGTSGPNGSGTIEDVFAEYFAGQGLYTEETAFDGRSDYGPFIDAGIPAGGLFSGAEDIKTEAQAAPDKFGGKADVAYDECYHSACDDISNVNTTGLDQLADGAAHAVFTFAQTTSSVNGTAKASSSNSGATAEHKGHALKR
jgi:Zn-dependent M28 family amino/carboxypeptidase